MQLLQERSVRSCVPKRSAVPERSGSFFLVRCMTPVVYCTDDTNIIDLIAKIMMDTVNMK